MRRPRYALPLLLLGIQSDEIAGCDNLAAERFRHVEPRAVTVTNR